ncbi:MAG TPA: cation-transporting P-type ATPase, partial [Candidatus Eisenbacteria bacterium]|nr:cation-transporting P-type ATPase [Candidatus Eisenbacteria bacterium]
MEQPEYSRDVSDIATALRTDPSAGLSDRDARERLERYGRNELAADKAVAAWRQFLSQFQDPLVVLLLVATAIS